MDIGFAACRGDADGNVLQKNDLLHGDGKHVVVRLDGNGKLPFPEGIGTLDFALGPDHRGNGLSFQKNVQLKIPALSLESARILVVVGIHIERQHGQIAFQKRIQGLDLEHELVFVFGLGKTESIGLKIPEGLVGAIPDDGNTFRRTGERKQRAKGRKNGQ